MCGVIFCYPSHRVCTQCAGIADNSHALELWWRTIFFWWW